MPRRRHDAGLSTPRQGRGRFGLIACVLSASLVAAACGGTGDQAAATSTSPPTLPASTPTTTGTTASTATTTTVPSTTSTVPPAAWPEVPDWAAPAVEYLEAYRTALNSGEVEQVFPFLDETVAWWKGDLGGRLRIGQLETLTGLLDWRPPTRLPGPFLATWFPTENGVGYLIDWIHEALPDGCRPGDSCARVEDVRLTVIDGAVVSHGAYSLTADVEGADLAGDVQRIEDRYTDIARRLSSGDPEEAAAMISDRPVWVDAGDGDLEQFVPRDAFAEQVAAIFADVPGAAVNPLTTADLGLPGAPRPAVFFIPGGVADRYGLRTIGGVGVYRQIITPELSFLMVFQWLERDEGIIELTAELEPEALAGWTEDGTTAPMAQDPAVWPAIPEPARKLTGTIEADEATISIYNGSEARQALVEWALGRYRAAGLPEPVPRTVSFPPSVECVLYAGLATDTGEGVDLQLCFGDEETCTGEDCTPSTAAESTLLHELGHVWTIQNVDDAIRAAFLDARGLEVWSDPGVDRDHLGTEHAAEILAWALLDEPAWAARLPDNDCEDLAAGFRALTGREPPRACDTG